MPLLDPVRSRENDEWVAALSAGGAAGERAQGELRSVLVSGLRRVLSSLGVSADLCEDFAQDALLRIRDRLDTFRGDGRFTTWALTIATRIAFDELRHKRWKDVSLEATTEDARRPLVFEPSTDGSQEKTMVRERVLSALRDVIEQKLTDKQRTVLVAELSGMPHSEIASSLGMNRNALYKLAHDARRKVKSQLESAGISETDVLWIFE